MIVRELLTRIGYTVDKTGEKRAEQSFGKVQSAARNMAARVAGLVSAGAVAFGLKRAIELASNAEETLSAIGILFEDQADSVLRWSKDFGEAAGRSEYALQGYAAQIAKVVGASLNNAEATGEMSTAIAEAAVDLASFYDATEEDTITALRAGLIGSYEPLQRFGVVLREGELATYALNKGFKTAWKDMSQGQKMMVRFRAIMEESSKAQGDAIRTSAGYANQLKRFLGNVNKVATDIGKLLLPELAGWLAKVNAIATANRERLVKSFEVLKNAFLGLGRIIGNFVDFFIESGTMMRTVLTGLILFTVAFFAPWLISAALVVAAIAGIILILDDLWAGLSRGEGVFFGLFQEFQTLVDQNDSYVDAVRLTLQTALDFWIHYFTGVENASWRMGEAIRAAFRSVIDFIVERWEFGIDVITRGLVEIVGFFSDKLEPVINAIFNTLFRMVGIVSDLGLGDILGSLGLGGPTRIAAPGSPAAGGGVNANQEININVNAPGGDGPGIAAAVGPVVGQAAAEGNRRTAQQLLLGGVTP